MFAAWVTFYMIAAICIVPFAISFFERFRWGYALIAIYVWVAGYTIAETENLPIGLGLMFVAAIILTAGDRTRYPSRGDRTG